MARYDRGYRGQQGAWPRGGAGRGGEYPGGFEGDFGGYDYGIRGYRAMRYGRWGEPAGGYYGGGPEQSGGWTIGSGGRGGYGGPGAYGGGVRGGVYADGGTYGAGYGRGGWGEGWGGGYDAYDRGIYGDEHPGYGGYPGGPVRGEYYGGGGYGAGRPSQGRGYDPGYARRPFLPEEAYRRHPEYDQPPGRRDWEAYRHEVDDEPSDAEVRERVCRRMEGDAWLDPERIRVEVADGVVTLTGEVDDFLEARYAWDDAWETAGVRGVVNNLTVRSDRPHDLHGDMVPQSAGERTVLEPGGEEAEREPETP